MISIRGWVAAVLGVAMLLLSACNAPRDPSSYQNSIDHVDVTLSLPPRAGGFQALATGALIQQVQTSLVFVVPDGTPSGSFYESLILAGHPQGLLNLATSTITLTLPTNQPLRLVEYTFSEPWLMEEIRNTLPIGNVPNVSSAFTVVPGSSELDIGLPVKSGGYRLSWTTDGGYGNLLSPQHFEQVRRNDAMREAFIDDATFEAVSITYGRDRNNGSRITLRSGNSVASDPRTITKMYSVARLQGAASSGGVPARAQMGGFFYNSGGSPGPVGDVFAVLSLDGANAYWLVLKCTTVLCNLSPLGQDFVLLGGGPVAGVMAPVAIGENATLYMDWNNDAANRFTFTVTPSSTATPVTVTFDPVAAGAPVAGAPLSANKELGTRVQPRAGEWAYAEGRFDNFDICATACGTGVTGLVSYDNFSDLGGVFVDLDHTKWNEGGLSQVYVQADPFSVFPAQTGVLHVRGSAGANVTGGNNALQTQLKGNPNLILNAHRVAGEVAISDLTTINAGGGTASTVRGHIRLVYAPFSKRNSGDSTNAVIAEIQIDQTNGGAIVAHTSGFVCPNAACTGVETVTGNGITLLNPVVQGQYYPFSVEYIGNKQFTVTFSGASQTLDFSAASHFDENEFYRPDIRVDVNGSDMAGDGGEMKMWFPVLEFGLP